MAQSLLVLDGHNLGFQENVFQMQSGDLPSHSCLPLPSAIVLTRQVLPYLSITAQTCFPGPGCCKDG